MTRVAFYGRLAEVAWRELCAVDVPPDVTTVGALRAWLPSVAPVLTGELGPTVRAALGETIVGDDAVIAADSDIAFLPPVSGG